MWHRAGRPPPDAALTVDTAAGGTGLATHDQCTNRSFGTALNALTRHAQGFDGVNPIGQHAKMSGPETAQNIVPIDAPSDAKQVQAFIVGATMLHPSPEPVDRHAISTWGSEN